MWCAPLVNGPLCCPDGDPGLALPLAAAETPGRPHHLTPYCAFPWLGLGREKSLHSTHPCGTSATNRELVTKSATQSYMGIPFGVLMGFGAYIVPHQNQKKILQQSQ